MNDRNLVKVPSASGDLSSQLIQKKFNELPEETQNALAEYAAKKRLELEAKSTEDYMTNRNAEENIDNHIRTAEALSRSRYTKGTDTVNSNIKTSSGTMNIQSKSGYCYVATATYKNENHHNIVILRDYRDRYLRTSIEGRAFIKVYYAVGKYLAVFPENFECIRRISKYFIDKIVDKIVIKYYI